MADFLDDLDGVIDSLDNSINKLTNNRTLNSRDFEENGFVVSPTPGADGNGLPSSKVPPLLVAKKKRELIHWFVPEFGVIKMYVNPSSISYNHSKQITEERTKGGFTLQYWGENLTQLTIAGTTGSSGVEGINVLHEIYRAEQLAFDTVGLTLASNNAAVQVAEQAVSGLGGLVGGLIGGAAGGAVGSTIANGLFGIDNINTMLAPRNVPSLAQFAFGVEMYHQGWVYRGYFKSMVVNEKADTFLWDYNIAFVSTQRRGYRNNYLPFHRSPRSPSGSSDSSWNGIPGDMSFGKLRQG